MATKVPAWADRKNVRESRIEAHLMKKMKQIGGKAYKWASPGLRGVPDRILIHPDFQGRSIYVELKAPGRKSTPAQVRVQQDLIDAGHAVFVLDSIELVDQLIHDLCELYGIEEGVT